MLDALSALGGFSTFQDGLLLGFPALFSIADPLGNALIFSQMTADRSHAERVMMARRVGLYGLIIMLGALWGGSYVLSFFGITLWALKVGGGLVVTMTGWHLLFGREPAAESPVEPQGPPLPATDMAFFPITMPLVIGPGAISVAITIGATRPDGAFDVAYLLGVSVAAGAVAGIVCLLFTYAEGIGRMVGEKGSRAIKRVVALLVLTIGVQIVALGVQDMLIAALSR